MENKKEKPALRKAVLGRLPLYLEFLNKINKDPKSYISSSAIARETGFGEVLVRKDLQMVSGIGKVRVGYKISTLTRHIQKALDLNHAIEAIVVGAGNLGTALYLYSGFQDYGIKIEAAFDVDVNKVNLTSRKKIYPLIQMKQFIQDHNIRLAILTVPGFSAQYVCDKLVEAGIEAIWSFSPKKVVVPDTVVFHHEDLALSLAHLKTQLKNHKK